MPERTPEARPPRETTNHRRVGSDSPSAPSRITLPLPDDFPHVIGIDGGGSQTVALLANLEGRVYLRKVGGPSNLYAVGLPTAVRHLRSLLQGLWREVGSPEACRALCLGLAGLGRPEEQRQMRRALEDAGFPSPLLLTHDAHIALVAGTGGEPGILLISGTGSIAYGRDAEGREFRAGGWGPLLADEGSGYALGLEALRAVMRAYDGRGPQTRLTRSLLATLRLDAPLALVAWVEVASRREIARLASHVFEAAEQGDAVAQAILNRAAQELAAMARAVARHLPTDVPVILSGGVFRHHPAWVTRLRQELRPLHARLLDAEPAQGAVRLALSVACRACA